MEEDAPTDGAEIRDTETGEGVNWSEIFFTLHKHCNLNKWEIWEYTVPQITELVKSADKYIQFEVETRLMPFGVFGGGNSKEASSNKDSDAEYEVATEDDVLQLAKILGGG